jgi:hypothetical protein
MAANTTPIFTNVGVFPVAQISSANTNRDGTGTIVSVVTGSTNGTRITRITIQAIVTTTAGMVRLYIKNGAVVALWKEVAVTATTGSASVPEFSSVLEFTGERALILPSGVELQASTHNAEAFNVFAEGGNY